VTEPEEPEEWRIPRRVWFILFSWGLAVLGIAGLLSLWIWHSDRQQDRAMCVMMDLFTSGPPPVAGPAGERGRAVLAAMRAYQATLDCDGLRPAP
jgi:hypothetical protein